jgi:hypothetical protein
VARPGLGTMGNVQSMRHDLFNLLQSGSSNETATSAGVGSNIPGVLFVPCSIKCRKWYNGPQTWFRLPGDEGGAVGPMKTHTLSHPFLSSSLWHHQHQVANFAIGANSTDIIMFADIAGLPNPEASPLLSAPPPLP